MVRSSTVPFAAESHPNQLITLIIDRNFKNEGDVELAVEHVSKSDGIERTKGLAHFRVVDQGLSLTEHGIRMDWNAPYDETAKPRWMRQHEYVACKCNACFFFKERKTSGIQSRPHTGTPSKRERKKNQHVMEKELI